MTASCWPAPSGGWNFSIMDSPPQYITITTSVGSINIVFVIRQVVGVFELLHRF